MDEKNRLMYSLIAKRKYCGLTQADMAGKLGIGQPSYSRLESGDSEITLRQFLTLCDALNIQVKISSM